MGNKFSAPLPHDPQGEYTLTRHFNSADLLNLVMPNTFSPFQFTTFRMKSSSYPLRPLPVCEGQWRFLPTDTHTAFTSFYNSVIKASAADPAAAVRGLFVLTPTVLWNQRMEALLGIRLPTIYLYAGVAMTGDWLTQQAALQQQFPVLVQGPTLFDYYRGNYIAGEYPFSAFEIAGAFGWRADKNSLYASIDHLYRQKSTVPLERDDANALFLMDADVTSEESGAVRIKVAPGWAVEIALTTGNDHYFGILSGLPGVEVASATTNYIRGSANHATFTLLGGDELQIGIDANEHPAIAPTNFYLHLASQGWAAPVKAPTAWIASHAGVDDECWVELISARRIGTSPPPPGTEAPDAVYGWTHVDGQLRLEPLQDDLTFPQRKKLEMLRGQIGIPSHRGIPVPLPPLVTTGQGEGELSIQCGFRVEHLQDDGTYAPAPLAPMPFESIYQRAVDSGLQNEAIEGGVSHPIVQLMTHSSTPRNAAIKFAEVAYFPESDSTYIGGLRFDECYPSGLISSEWDGYFIRWKGPYDDVWRRSVISRNGTTYIEIKPGTPTVASVFKRGVKCAYLIDSPRDDKLLIKVKPFVMGDNDITDARLSYTCAIEIPVVLSAPETLQEAMFYDPRVIKQWIDAHLEHYNTNNTTRTAWLLAYYRSHPELAWALFEHVLSRNFGYLMTDIHRIEEFLKLVTGLLADWVVFFVALLAAGALSIEAVILIILFTIVSMVLRGLDYQAEVKGAEGFEDVTAELRDQIMELLEGCKKALRVAKIADAVQKVEAVAAEYIFCSFQRTLESVSYLTTLNAFPQIAAYRWVKEFGTNERKDRSADLFKRLPSWQFGTSSFMVDEWIGFCSSAMKATKMNLKGFWLGMQEREVLVDPDVIRHAATMWIDQHGVLETAICGEEASARPAYIGYYFKPVHLVLRAINFFEGFSYVVPAKMGGSVTVFRLRPTTQTISGLLDEYGKWLNMATSGATVSALKAVLDPTKPPVAGSLDQFLMKFPPLPPSAPPVNLAAELNDALRACVLGPNSIYDRLVALLDRQDDIAKLVPPPPPVRDGFGDWSRRIEMMLELYRGFASPKAGSPHGRIEGLLLWLTENPNDSGSRADYFPAEKAPRLMEIIDTETSDDFARVTGVSRRFQINRAGLPMDWSASPAGKAMATQLKSRFVSTKDNPLAQFSDPFTP